MTEGKFIFRTHFAYSSLLFFFLAKSVLYIYSQPADAAVYIYFCFSNLAKSSACAFGQRFRLTLFFCCQKS
jgi:hypothetical protein